MGVYGRRTMGRTERDDQPLPPGAGTFRDPPLPGAGGKFRPGDSPVLAHHTVSERESEPLDDNFPS